MKCFPRASQRCDFKSRRTQASAVSVTESGESFAEDRWAAKPLFTLLTASLPSELSCQMCWP